MLVGWIKLYPSSLGGLGARVSIYLRTGETLAGRVTVRARCIKPKANKSKLARVRVLRFEIARAHKVINNDYAIGDSWGSG
jgi:hypothetical protein